MSVLYVILCYVFWINVIAFFVYGIDKHQAHYRKRRVSEAMLIFLAVIGGALGALSAMLLFRHKTLKKKFTITVPILLVLQAALMVFLPMLLR